MFLNQNEKQVNTEYGKLPKMLTIRECADMLNLSYNCIHQMCIDNKVVHIKAGTKYLVNFDNLVNYLSTGEVE